MKTIFFLQCSLFLSFFAPQSIVAQRIIKLDNPSFEDFPQHSHAPTGWFDCGFAGETPPDIQPSSFQVRKLPQHGKSYLGMIVRDNNTWEAVGQKLQTPLMPNQTYEFRLQLCKSEWYIGKSKSTNKEINYVTPAIVRIWGGNTDCSKDENLADSEPIENTDWKNYSFHLKPKRTYNYLMIEVCYKMPTLFPYNGNVLIDNASDLVPIESKVQPNRVYIPIDSQQVTIIEDSLKKYINSKHLCLYSFDTVMKYDDYRPVNKQEVERRAIQSVLVSTTDYEKIAGVMTQTSITTPKKCLYQPRNAIVFYSSEGRILGYMELCFHCHKSKSYGSITNRVGDVLFTIQNYPDYKELSALFKKYQLNIESIPINNGY